MQSFFHKIAKLKCGWNDIPLTDETFHKLCRKHKISVQYMPLKVDGFYTCDKNRHYIAINNRLTAFQQLVTMFHEFGHFLMHSPSTDAIDHYCGSATRSRDEVEADAFAYCAVLPLELLKTREPEEILDSFGSSFFMKRLEIYERFQI
jgi:Zn-dependent peptidase ImmA (M78 family)